MHDKPKTPVRGALCGPKFLRGFTERCDGSCCGLGVDGMPDPVLVEKLNRRDEAWRRILNGEAKL